MRLHALGGIPCCVGAGTYARASISLMADVSAFMRERGLDHWFSFLEKLKCQLRLTTRMIIQIIMRSVMIVFDTY